MMKTLLMKLLPGILIAGLFLVSCKKDAVEDNDEEIITTLKLTLVPIGGGNPLVFQFEDADGPGGAAPVQDEIVLPSFQAYSVTLQLLNKTTSPVEDITLEVAAEADAHRFYYNPSAGSNLNITSLNDDPNGIALGITSTWATGAAATGKLKITLRHYPAIPPNKATNDPVDSPKSGTDIEVEFNTRIQ